MAVYGYHRTSTREQHLDRGIHEIEAFCRERNLELVRIYTDQKTGKTFDRPQYTVLKEDILRNNDILIITEVDRLGRNKQEIIRELQRMSDEGVRLMILEIPTTLMDLSQMDDGMAKLVLETVNHLLIEIYAAMAEAELQKKEKRQREGIEAKRARGEWEDYGRPRIKKPENWDQVITRWRAGEITAVEAMHWTKVKKTTFYKLVKEEEKRV